MHRLRGQHSRRVLHCAALRAVDPEDPQSADQGREPRVRLRYAPVILFNVDHFNYLTIVDIPVSVTFGLFNDFEVMDPDVFEEQLIEDSVSVMLGSNGKVLSVIKPGGKSIPEDTLKEITAKARERYGFVYNQIDAFRNSLSVAMNVE